MSDETAHRSNYEHWQGKPSMTARELRDALSGLIDAGFGDRQVRYMTVDGSRGYTPDNCSFVCVIVNLSINQWGQEAFARMAMAFAENRATSGGPLIRRSDRKSR